jgi:adenylate cyclase
MLAEAHNGRGGCVHIVGEAGVGKSRLLREFRALVDESVAQFASRCASFETDTPYAVVSRLLRLIFSIVPGAAEIEARAAIARGMTEIGGPWDPLDALLLLHVLGYGEYSGLDPQSKQGVLVNLLRRLLERWAGRTPVLIILEDLHWVDSASNAVLIEIARDVVSRRCLLVMTSRAGWTPPSPTSIIALEPLAESNARALIESAFGVPVDEALAEAGVPLRAQRQRSEGAVLVGAGR